ncbi:histidine kinase [Paenibacillus sacheonensis]|uniref:HAMP domain-containing protein n=1 Tax=Paenibacillus sacheonensis TaxID=742054 RepID=A0A7X4YLW4_9BACL|nr:two-component system sensor histidine kinase YesM [Paenibacillus sacheonensis]NBC68783.1 HAMP domain-containing protein [Paenibacillus sacheonensis]
MQNGQVRKVMLTRLFTRYRNMLIRSKITIVFIPIVVLPLFVVIYTSNYVFTKSTIEKTKANIAGESSLIISRIDSLYNSVETSSRVLTVQINSAYQEKANSLELPEVMLRNEIQTALSFNLDAFKDIESIAFIDTHGSIYASNTKLGNNLNLAIKSEMVASIKKIISPVRLWFPMEIRNFLVTDDKTPILSVGNRINNIDTGELLGVLVFNVREDTISSIFPKDETLNTGVYTLVDNTGTIISSQNKADLLQKSIADKRRYLVSTTSFSQLGWELINQVPLRQLSKDKLQNSLIILIVGLLCTLIAVFGAFFLSRLIAKPIVQLTHTAKRIREGNLNTTSLIRTQDEVGILASVFNEMMAQVKLLLEKVGQEQKKKREYEFALIQSQIKPHFFYNSLDLIYVQCESGQAKEAAETTMALADFYRVSLSKGKEIIPLKEELQNTQAYLFIQKTRYSDIIDFSIDVGEELGEYSIMKLTLQPLVENSIYHGLRTKNGGGKIEVSGYKQHNDIVLVVADNGVGIPAEKLQELQVWNKDGSGVHSFGLRSVNERIKLYYGEEYGITINSEKNAGTVITIRIPQRREVSDHQRAGSQMTI